MTDPDFRILDAMIFRADTKTSAFDSCAAWLSAQRAEGFEPINVLAVGSSARVTLSSGVEALLILRRADTRCTKR